MGFDYEKETVEKMIEYAEEKLLITKKIKNTIQNFKLQKGLNVTEILFLDKTTLHSLKGVEHALNAV